jgi:hypothetical protein
MSTTLDKDMVKKDLAEKICQITFTKADGSTRVMNCTLNPTMIPVVEAKESTGKTKAENPEVQPVYDVEVQGWRSFRWDSVQAFRSDLNL